jgi:hypothetical protein
MGTFGYLGYWAHRWEERAAEILDEKETEMRERRRRRREIADGSAVTAALAEASE